jgi:hypothetical protein
MHGEGEGGGEDDSDGDGEREVKATLQPKRRRSYRPIHPPSTVTTSPLTYALAGLANQTTAPLKSSGLPHLPAGIRANMLFARSSSLIKAAFISVAMYPGAIALTLMPLLAHSLLNAFVNWATPPFEAA